MSRPTESAHGLDSSRHTPRAVRQGTGSVRAPRQSAEHETVFASADGTRRVAATSGENPRKRLRATRRGVTVLIVLLLLSITLGLSYAMVRSQTTALQIQQNANVRVSAHRAALTGLTVALKEMHTSEWCDGDGDGVNTTVCGTLSDHESYTVTYTTGDDSLDSEDPANAMKFACRVTLLATGTATDPSDPARTATHRARAVVRLVPRALNEDDEPDEWREMTEDYTVYQWRKDDFQVNVPFRIEGAVRVQHKLKLARSSLWYPWYPWSSSAREDYLTDLNAMRLGGGADLRPLTGPIDLPRPAQEPGLFSLLQSTDADPNDVGQNNVTQWNHPGQVSTYRIYPGGKEYSADVLGYSQQNVTWQPNPETNPLGIYYREGTLRLCGNVTIEGTLIVKGNWNGDVEIEGTNVLLQPHDLPPLYGSDRPIRLPVAVVDHDFEIYPNAQSTVKGLLTVWNEFRVCKDGQRDMAVTFQGPIVAREILIRPRSEWYDGKWSDWWDTQYQAFLDQEATGEPYFPAWLSDVHGLDSHPFVLIQPEPRDAGEPAPRYHWKNQYDAIYVPHPNDIERGVGLRWDLLEWTDSL